MTYETPKLPYAYNALEPYLDEETLKIHHGKHHKAYTDKLNAALTDHPDLAQKDAEYLIAHLGDLPESVRTKVRNFGGGHINHTFFWESMKKDAVQQGAIVDEITSQWGSFDAFKEEFSNSAATLFGSGWTWLVRKHDNTLGIMNTLNQDSPITNNIKPLLVIDVWEHAYYLKYRQARADFIAAWWNVVDWQKVDERDAA